MKKSIALVIALMLTVSLIGCTPKQQEAQILDTITSEFATYYKMSDGTWQKDNYSYQYRLEISGRMHNAVQDVTFVYLSNLENITFEQAWKAAGLSSSTSDYFSVEDAVLVELKTE